MHYNAAHRNVCRECGRSLPTSHLLDLHLQEWHDAMFLILAARQNMVPYLSSFSHLFARGAGFTLALPTSPCHSGPFIPDVPGFHVHSDSVLQSQTGSSSRALPLHLDFGNCSDIFCFISSIKEGLYRIQILCRRHPFWSYPAGLTIADLPG